MELGIIFCCPPVVQVTILIILATLVVKTMCHFVAKGGANYRVQQSVIGKFTFVARYNYVTARYHNFVISRVVICIVSLWFHIPFGTVNRLAIFILMEIEFPKVSS